MASLKIENLNFRRAKKSIFTNFNLLINESRIVGLVGESGKGKTTLASLIAGHLIPDSGSIYLNEIKITAPLRDIIIVHQEDDLFPWLSVEDQLKFVNFKNYNELEIDNLLKHFSLFEYKKFFPYQLSGGMKKRLSLLRALIVNPKWIILDEALSSLDKEIAYKILDVIIPYTKDKKIGLIIITHQEELFSNYLEEIIRI